MSRLMGLNEVDIVRLANATKLRIAMHVLKGMEAKGGICEDDLAEIIDQVGELIRECER